MERWLSKSRVLLALSGVLLVSALNRHDPMVFGMFLFLATLSVFGLVLPWLSLQSMHIVASGTAEVIEGQASGVQLAIERRAWWPAFMVEVETHWQWGSKTIVLSHTVPVMRARQRHEIGTAIRFPCRGNYRLSAVVLASGFPLGLVTARHSRTLQGIAVLVLPQPQPVLLPERWSISHDPLGNQTTQRLGQSFELGSLRPYVAGEPMGRVNWRASARSGEVVIQHFQQSGSPLLHLVTDIPPEHELGQPEAPTEHALRIAAGLCRQAQAAGVRVRAHLQPQAAPLTHSDDISRALAAALPGSLPLAVAIHQACLRLSEGMQLAVVVSPRWNSDALLRTLSEPALGACPVLVYIAAHPALSASDLALGAALARALTLAGFQVFLHPA